MSKSDRKQLRRVAAVLWKNGEDERARVVLAWARR